MMVLVLLCLYHLVTVSTCSVDFAFVCLLCVDRSSEGDDRSAGRSASEDGAFRYKDARAVREGGTPCQILGRERVFR